MELISQQVEAYASSHSSSTDLLLEELLQQTIISHPKAHMVSGKVQGLVLEMISKMIRPSRILEIGTFTGYSALCLAKGLTANGQLHTIEIRETDAANARSFFDRSEYAEKIKLHVGDALAIISTLKEDWDLVFIDADKVNYLHYYRQVLPRLRQGGFILADNVLFHGEVLESPVKGKNAKAIQEFNDHILKDDAVENVLLTVRDGIMLIRKK